MFSVFQKYLESRVALSDEQYELIRSIAIQKRISTVGPFVKFGEPVVAACVKSGTDYLDCTGEPCLFKK